MWCAIFLLKALNIGKHKINNCKNLIKNANNLHICFTNWQNDSTMRTQGDDKYG